MQRAWMIVKIACLLAITGFACAFFWQLRVLTKDAGAMLAKVDPVLTNVTQATKELGELSQTINAASAAETAKLQADTEELRKTERAIRASTDSLRQVFIDLHQQTLPAMNRAIADADSAELQIGQAVATSTKKLDPSLDNLNAATTQLALQLPTILNRTDATAANVQQSTANLAAATQDVKQVADKFREDYLKPQKLAWSLLKELIGLGGSMAQMVK